MSYRCIKGVAAAMILGLGIAACSSGGAKSSSSTSKSVTLTEEATTGVTFTQNFNPFDVNSLATEMNMRTLVYEPLFEFNALQPGVIHPWLGKTYAWSNGGKTLTVALRPGVKWSDGQAFTSADVAFTYNTINTNAAANYSGVAPIASITTPDASTGVLNFKTAQHANLFAIPR